MLTSIILHDFKSYKTAKLPLSSLTLLIGANASGKSNVLEALHLLSWLAQGQKLTNIRYHMQDSDAIFRGRIEEIGHNGTNSFRIECVANAKTNTSIMGKETSLASPVLLGITFEIVEGELHISDEYLYHLTREANLYWVEEKATLPSSDLTVCYNNFKRGGNKPRITCTDQMAVFTQLDSPATFAQNTESKRLIPEIAKSCQELLKNILFLDPIPSLMRNSEFKTEKKLRGDARNLSGVIFNLCQEKIKRNSLLSLIRSLPEQDISDITFYESDKGKVMLELEESFGDKSRKWDATILSDGTLRVLAIAAALLSAPEGSLVVIEEVDNGVHPSRAKHLMREMQQIAENRNLRLLLSTHNPALMDAVPDSALGNVVFCYRDNDGGDSRLVQLQDIADYSSLVAQGPLGQLSTARIIERFAKDSTPAEERKQKALDWISNLSSKEEK